MLPFYHPTTIALIDDDDSFLRSFDDLLSRDFVVRRFTNSLHGLNHLVDGDTAYASGIARLSPFTQREGWEYDEAARHKGLLSSMVGEVRRNPRRFETVSVAVVDAHMPDVDGMMICRALRRRPVRTVLLTGNASEHLALAAFNDGAIDRFASKHDPEFATLIVQHVRDLQHAYFRRVTLPALEALQANALHFILDSAFVRYFDKLVVAEKIVEYYVRNDPPGVDLIKSDGRTVRLIVRDRQTAQAHARSARAAHADAAMVAAMERGEILTLFPGETGSFEPRFRDDWHRYASAAQGVGETWLAAVLPCHDTPADAPRNFVSFDEFRQHAGAT
jgi:CheY-like chemotaxis protein